LTAANIGTGIHYPIPLHLQNAYKNFEHKQGDFPVSERVAAEILSLPMCPLLTEEMQNRVVSEITNYMQTAMVGVKVSSRRN
jgi:dTDP-4-amino-4,6-dideoxygalactose transaminase